MDWTQVIITALTLLFTGGGLVTIVTLNDKKTAAMLSNVEKVLQSTTETNKEWKDIAEERKNRCTELKADLDKKDNKIDELRKEKEYLMETQDDLRTENAIAVVMKCTKTGCAERHPPFGAELKFESCRKCREKETIESE